MSVFSRFFARVYAAWVVTQVELHGHYSCERLRSYNAFAQTASYTRVLALCLLAPFPCLAIISLIDAVPLESPERGSNANYVHWLRNFVVIMLVSVAQLWQLPLYVPALSLSFSRLFFVSIVSSAAGVAFQFLMSHVIGFPLPFSLVFGEPIWFVFACGIFTYYFGRLLRDDADCRTDLLNYTAVLSTLIGLTVVYPAFIYGFQSIDSASQKVFVVLLPIIKIAAKNWVSHFLGKMDDRKPEIVIFNVEIFHALYVACCMQSSTSISTTLVLSSVDWIQAWLSIRDVNLMLDEIKLFMDKIPPGHALETKNFLDVALAIVDEDKRVRTHPAFRNPRSARSPLKHSAKQCVRIVPSFSNDSSAGPAVKGQHATLISKASIMPVVAAAVSDGTSGKGDGAAEQKVSNAQPATIRSGLDVFSDAERLHFVHQTTALLYMTEFVLLVEYTEVIVPVIYSLYIVTAFNLPNREHYSQLAKMDSADLQRTVTNVFIYAGFELVSFLVMSSILKKKLRLESFKQLAFVLDSQWTMVQAKLILWFFYVVQISLDHCGTDFSFQFAWLHHSHCSRSPSG